MRVQNIQNQNFGAIRIMNKNPQEVKNLHKLANEEVFEKISIGMMPVHLVSLAGAKSNLDVLIGKETKGISWNIMSEFGSGLEKELIKKLTDSFTVKNLHKKFDIVSVPDESAQQAVKNFQNALKKD